MGKRRPQQVRSAVRAWWTPLRKPQQPQAFLDLVGLPWFGSDTRIVDSVQCGQRRQQQGAEEGEDGFHAGTFGHYRSEFC